MSFSVYQSSVPVFERSLNAFSAILDKAATHAETNRFDPAIYLTLRLRPDMLPFGRQVQIFCDHAKNGPTRLAGLEPPKFDDVETSLGELKTRIRRTLDLLASLDQGAVNAGAEREIVFPVGPKQAKMVGADFITHFVLPNFHFHLTTAYGILRYAGVPLSKMDFMGAIPGFTVL